MLRLVLHAARAGEIAALVTAENGTPAWFTQSLQPALIEQTGAFLRASEAFGWEEEVSSPGGARAVVRREPVGVVAAIIPFVGPLVTPAQKDRVLSYIRSGLEQGARLVVGGLDTPEGIEQGNYVRPTVFADVDNSMTIVQEEIFGPVLVIIPFDDEDDAVRIANDSPYGLSGGVWTSDTERGLAVARRIRTGTFLVNGAPAGFDAPFGGYKASGIGREFGTVGLTQYVEHKSIAL